MDFALDAVNKPLDAVHKQLDWFSSTIDKVKFRDILLFWAITIVVCGILYFVLSSWQWSTIQFSHPSTGGLGGFLQSEYFSVIASLNPSFAYGDAVPLGFSKLLAVLQGIFGLLMFWVVMSKLVSSRQERILAEVYELSFDEKLNRIRQSLSLSRRDLGKLFISGRTPTRGELREVWLVLSNIESTLADAIKITCREFSEEQRRYLRTVDEFHVELITNSVYGAIIKIAEFLASDEASSSWRHPRIAERVESIIDLARSFAKFHLARQPSHRLGARLKDLVAACERVIVSSGKKEEREKVNVEKNLKKHAILSVET